EMEARYQQLARVGARNLAAYNQLAAQGRVAEPLPYVVVVIDELADLMLVAAAEVEDSICRLAQMARAAGIHLIIATQRPSTDVITGLIKANIPSRLAFAVSSQVDSRTILDTGGAERLLGRGDMLYHPLGEPKPVRAQGCLVTDREIEQVVAFWKEQGPPQYKVDLFEEEAREESADAAEADDALYDEAVKLVVEAGQASVSMLQRRFRIGYARAARLIDMMEQRGVVGPYQGSKPREVMPAFRRREHPA
ncbi:MAG: DNA translocase FtsK, partial [Bacillota bacterium]